MTIIDGFMIGTTLEDMQSFEELGIHYDPDATYRPFAVVDKLGDGSEEGNGFPVATWHFNAMGPGNDTEADADILYDFLDGNISAPVYIRTRLNRLNMDSTDYQWATFSSIMTWMTGDEQNPAFHTLDVTITFNRLVLIPDYP